MATTSETARQAAVLRLLWTPPGLAFNPEDLRTAGLAPGGEAGLDAHRRHARASARRNLMAAYPTVSAMLGEEGMAALAVSLWHAEPPVRGDVGEWGEGLPALLATQPELQNWPWLADVARLDWARHRCGRTAGQPVDTDSLLALGSADPAQLRLALQPHVMTVCATWPLDGLWRAQQAGSADEQALGVQAVLSAHGGETQTVVCWWGEGVQQCVLNDADAAWMALLSTTGISLHTALDRAPPDFDFAAWFTQALRQGWLQGAQACEAAQ
jgi:hypothetical protein